MKRLNFLILVICSALIFLGCTNDDFETTKVLNSDQEMDFLKSAKNVVEFSGTSNFYADGEIGTAKVLPNEKTWIKGGSVIWHDVATDPLVTGITTWQINQKINADGTFKFGGKTELLVDGGLGLWQMSWKGSLIITEEGFPVLKAYAVGQGKEGDVKGLVGEWTYTFDFEGEFYAYEGSYH